MKYGEIALTVFLILFGIVRVFSITVSEFVIGLFALIAGIVFAVELVIANRTRT